jgi:hypothetical protein
MSTWQIVTSPGVPVVLFLYGHVMLLGLAYTAGTSPYPIPIYPSPNSSHSIPTMVVHQHPERRLRLHTYPDLQLRQFGRNLSSHLAPLRLPPTPKQSRYRRDSTWMSIFLAPVFCHGSAW